MTRSWRWGVGFNMNYDSSGCLFVCLVGVVQAEGAETEPEYPPPPDSSALAAARSRVPCRCRGKKKSSFSLQLPVCLPAQANTAATATTDRAQVRHTHTTRSHGPPLEVWTGCTGGVFATPGKLILCLPILTGGHISTRWGLLSLQQCNVLRSIIFLVSYGCGFTTDLLLCVRCLRTPMMMEANHYCCRLNIIAVKPFVINAHGSCSFKERDI